MTRYGKIAFKLSLFFTCFVSLAALTALIFTHSESPLAEKPTQTRAPSSVTYDEDGEPVFWEQSLDEIEQASAKDPSFKGTGLPKQKVRSLFSHMRTLSLTEAERMTGLTAKRARLVRFHVENFKAAVSRLNQADQRYVIFPLFDDAELMLRLERPSSYSVNTGVYWGQVLEDPQSQVRVFVDGFHMNATIDNQGRVYRVMTAGGEGPEHVIIEASP